MTRMLHKASQFIVDSKGVKQAAVVPIDIYNELMTLQKAPLDNKPGSASSTTSTARGRGPWLSGGQAAEPRFSWSGGLHRQRRGCGLLREAVIELRQELLGGGCSFPTPKGFIFTADQLFQQPEPGREPGGSNRKRAGCLAKQRRLRPQSNRVLARRPPDDGGPATALAHVALSARAGGPLIRKDDKEGGFPLDC